MPTIQSNRSTARLARFMTGIFFVGGLASTLVAARISQQRHETEVMRIFSTECEAMRNSVSRQLDLFFDVLVSIGKLHEMSDRVSGEDFEEFTSKGLLFQRRILSAYGFVQRMPHGIRAALAGKKNGGLVIMEPNASGAFVEAGLRPEYFPLIYQDPADSLAFPLGADMAAFPGVAEVIMRMNASNTPVIASSLRLQGHDGSIGYFVFSPLTQEISDSSRYLSGFTVSILWPQEILDRALSDVAAKDVLVRFFDPEITAGQVSDSKPAKFQLIENVTVADRIWQFETKASPEYLSARGTVLPMVILLAGGLITFLGTATMWLLASRTRRIETVVAERTSDLKKANELLSDSRHERMRLEKEILDISEREKQQLGHDLHDSLGQKLTGAVFLSRTLAGNHGDQDEETKSQAARITEILKESVAQVRRMARGLSPVELGEDGLNGALRRLAEETSTVYGITCLFHQTDDHPVPPEKAAHHLYAIALEAVNNAIKHGQAKEVVIELSHRDGRNMLIIEDDGKGFDTGSTQRGGMGLRIMHYRATMIGGHLDISRRPIGGMQVLCVFAAEGERVKTQISTSNFQQSLAGQATFKGGTS